MIKNRRYNAGLNFLIDAKQNSILCINEKKVISIIKNNIVPQKNKTGYKIKR